MIRPASDPHARANEPGRVTDVARLVDRAQTGSRAAYAELVHHFHARLYNFLLRRTRFPEDAEDLTQETLVRAWQRLDQYDARWQFSTWLFTIASRLAVSHGRRRPPPLALADDPEARTRSDPGTTLSDREQGRDLWRLADKHLGATARAALWLHYAEDLSARDIARVLNRSQVAVRVMLHRARAVLAARAETTATQPNGPPPRPVVGIGRAATGGLR